MYATICRHTSNTEVEDRARAGRALASRLGALPGFVAYVLLEGPDGACIAVSIFEDQRSLAVAEQLAVSWLAEQAAAPRAAPPDIVPGEVIAQRGL
jgi:hypothetical protein